MDTESTVSVESFFRDTRPNHRKCQEELYELLTGAFGVTSCVLEKYKGRNRADLFMVVEQVHIALEVQISNLSIKELHARTKEYFRRGVAVLWLLPQVIGGAAERFELKKWQRWLHALYFGRIYCWERGFKVCPVHFLPYHQWIPERSWHNAYGEEESGGGYHKRYKRIMRPKMGPDLHLLDDFFWTHRRAWSFQNIEVPESLIYMDKKESWWESEEAYYEETPYERRQRRLREERERLVNTISDARISVFERYGLLKAK